MIRNATETIIGAVVLLAAVLFLLFMGQTTGLSTGAGGNYDLTARFRSAEGIVTGSDVRLAGVKIGTVTALSLDPVTYLAEARLAISEPYRIPDDSEAVVASEGLLGGAFIEIAPGGSEFMLASGDEILSTQSAVSLLNLLIKYATSGGSEAGAPE